MFESQAILITSVRAVLALVWELASRVITTTLLFGVFESVRFSLNFLYFQFTMIISRPPSSLLSGVFEWVGEIFLGLDSARDRDRRGSSSCKSWCCRFLKLWRQLRWTFPVLFAIHQLWLITTIPHGHNHNVAGFSNCDDNYVGLSLLYLQFQLWFLNTIITITIMMLQVSQIVTTTTLDGLWNFLTSTTLKQIMIMRWNFLHIFIFLDAKASPSTYPCEWVSEWLGLW